MNSPSANTPSSASSPAPPSSISNKPYEGDTEKRHFRTDNVNLSRTGNKTRDNSIGLMYNGLAYRATESVDEVLLKAVEVEHAVFTKFKSSESNGYRTKLRSLFANLKRKDNMQLGRQIRSGTIVPEILVTMTEQELAPEQKAKDDLLARENMMKAQVPMAEKSISTALRCGKCGQKKVSYSQAQTRSADEPMTTFCECLNCGNRWKVNNTPLHVFTVGNGSLTGTPKVLVVTPISGVRAGAICACRFSSMSFVEMYYLGKEGEPTHFTRS